MFKKNTDTIINENTFNKIDKFLLKKGHEKIFSIYLENYNRTNLYIRFDYIKKISVYKVTWFDLNFLDFKNLDLYFNTQIVNKNIAITIMQIITKIKYVEEERLNNDIIGDKVHICFHKEKNDYNYTFTRFLPYDWSDFIDPIVLTFSYLPRTMDIFLSEIFAIFDGTEEIFTYTKPIKFDLQTSSPLEHFKSPAIENGTKLYKSGRVLFLEEIKDKYYCIVEDREPHLVILNQIDETHAMMWCNCKSKGLCAHTYAALLALRHKDFNNFYKVQYNGKDETLLDKVMVGNFYLCYGINNDKMLLISLSGDTFATNIMKKGKCMFEVIEDDDNCSLSKLLKDYQK